MQSQFLIFPLLRVLVRSVTGLFFLLYVSSSFLAWLFHEWGAAIAAYSAYVLPVALLGLYSATYSGGGANIGLGLLALAAPGAVPIFMLIGLVVGESWAQNKAPNSAFKRDAEKRGVP
jgi:hypothetical protein